MRFSSSAVHLALLLLYSRRRRKEAHMLRISVASDSSQAIQFQLEGNLAGPWVEELRKLADEALSQKKAVSLDLDGVRFVDTQGVALLREFSRRRISQANCSQFVIQQMKEV